MLTKMDCANVGGGGNVNKFAAAGVYSTTSSSFADTGALVSEAVYVALFATLNSTIYKDLFKIENGEAVFIDGDVGTGGALFYRVDVSGSTVKVGQSMSTSAMNFSAVVLSEV